MQLISSAAEMSAAAHKARMAGETLALVPTMGALHSGHLELVREARRRASHVTVSIFVNPTQFGPDEDLDKYPRTLESDLEALKETGGADIVFVPQVEDMYPDGEATRVTITGLGDHLCGRTRPGHFDGVTTIVTKLLVACAPHVAVFGRKDIQQFYILKRLVTDLLIPVEMVGVETVREEDGLALSSRNRFLDGESRAQATVLSKALKHARAQVESGELAARPIVDGMHEIVSGATRAEPQYIEIVAADDLQPVESIAPGQEIIIAMAVFFGETRLIDNTVVKAPKDQS